MRVKTTREDEIIKDFIAAAALAFEDTTNRSLVTTEYYAGFRCWAERLILPRGRIRKDDAVVVVTYLDVDGNEKTVDSSSYTVEELPLDAADIRFVNDFDRPELFEDSLTPVTVEFSAGYGSNAGDIERDARIAVQAIVSYYYNNRPGEGDLPMAARMLLNKLEIPMDYTTSMR